MPTVYQRLQRLGYDLNQIQKIQVGILINEAFKKLPRSKETRFGKVISSEPDGTFTVIFYPHHFKGTIDTCITCFCSENNIKPSLEPLALNQVKTHHKPEIQ